MDFASIAKTIAGLGLPILARVLGGAVAGPAGALAAGALASKIAEALGLASDATPDAINAAITANPAAAAVQLSTLEQKATSDLEFAKLQVGQNDIEAKSASWFIAGWRPGFAWSIVVWVNLMLGTGWLFLLLGKIDLAQFLGMWNAPWLLFAGMIGVRSAEKWGGVATAAMRKLTGGAQNLSEG